MKNLWKSNIDGSFTLQINGKNEGVFQNTTSANNCYATIDTPDSENIVVRSGIWKNTITVIDSKGTEVLTAKPITWFGSTYKLNFDNQNYSLKVSSNPLVKWSIFKEDKLQLTYGLLTENREIALRVTGGTDIPVLFHFLLWYLMYPVIIENTFETSELQFVLDVGVLS